MGVIHPRLGFTGGVELLQQRVTVAVRPAQDGVDESRFGLGGVPFGERDGLVDGGVWRRLQEKKLVKSEAEDVGDDRSRWLVREPREQELQGELPSQATIEQLGDEGAVRAA